MHAFLFSAIIGRMNKVNHKGLRTWIEVDRKAIRHNFELFRRFIGKKTKLLAVVKSNAYGHGLIDFSREIDGLGADFLGVDSIVEGLALRRAGIAAPILVLGYTLPELIPVAAENNIAITVSTYESFNDIKRAKLTKAVTIHIKVDTGMHRQGFVEEEIKKVVGLAAAEDKKFIVEGLFTHFAAAKNPDLTTATRNQIAVFRKWLDAFKRMKIKVIAHAAASGGAMIYPDSHFDMVRIGVALYGLWPSSETEAYFRNRIKLIPALTWKTIITEIKRFPKGSRFGYDLTGIVARDSVTAICPVGYWHGYSRALSGIGTVLVNGHEARILGKVSMDILIIDVTDVPRPKVGDEVVLIGRSGKKEISAEYLAGIQDAWWYEFIDRINPLIKRIYK